MKQNLRQQKESFERGLIMAALSVHPHVKDAARELGMSWEHLYRRIEKLRIERPQTPQRDTTQSESETII